MKTKLFTVLLFALAFHQTESFAASTLALRIPGVTGCDMASAEGRDPGDIKVVVAEKRIWLIADEIPMKCLKVQIKNSEGKTVLEKCFTSKCTEWFLNIETLPKGEYTLYLGTESVEKFKK